MCVVTEMNNTMKFVEEKNMRKYLDQDEAKSILNKKRLELALTKYLDREDKIK